MKNESERYVDTRERMHASEKQRLDAIAVTQGFASYADYENQLKALSAYQFLQSQNAGSAIEPQDQPTFWNELF